MNKTIYNMGLHEEITLDGYNRVFRVAGGWIYRFWENENKSGVDGQWSENYRINSVFVPYSAEFPQAKEAQNDKS